MGAPQVCRAAREGRRAEEPLRAARAVILRCGRHATRVRVVADRGGVATCTVTSSFRELDDPFGLVFADAVERFRTLREQDVASSSSRSFAPV